MRCWFAPEKLKIGDEFRPVIDEAIRRHDKLLLILSEHSITSWWVKKEVETAFEEERKRHQTVLFPVRLDTTVRPGRRACGGRGTSAIFAGGRSTMLISRRLGGYCGI